ncbi:MAG TPA: BBE domain-containing protein [Chloroflexota bacterium]|nr:BBE domain-containing protein [Chloroflexota bacterium]
MIVARLAQLSDAARETVRLAATIGCSFTLDLLIRASAGEIESLVGPLDELWERQIVRAHGPNAYDFAHDEIREVAYDQIPPAQRTLLHRRVTHALEEAHERLASIKAKYDPRHFFRVNQNIRPEAN